MKKVRICALGDVPDGGLRVFRSEGRDILIFRRGKAVNAYDNRCPHMGFSLYLGEQKGNKLRCGFHGEVFNLENGEPEGRVVRKALIRIPVFMEEEMGGVGIYTFEGARP